MSLSGLNMPPASFIRPMASFFSRKQSKALAFVATSVRYFALAKLLQKQPDLAISSLFYLRKNEAPRDYRGALDPSLGRIKGLSRGPAFCTSSFSI